MHIKSPAYVSKLVDRHIFTKSRHAESKLARGPCKTEIILNSICKIGVLSHDILKYICDNLNMHCDDCHNAYSNYHKYILICHVTVRKK